MKDTLKSLEQLFYQRSGISEKDLNALFDSAGIPQGSCWRAIHRMIFDVSVSSKAEKELNVKKGILEPVMKKALKNIEKKDFSESAILDLIKAYNTVFSSVFQNQLKEVLDDLDSLTNEFKSISTKNQKEFKNLESETVETVISDLSVEEKVRLIKSKFKKTLNLFQIDRERLEQISNTDHLTGLFNRRFFDDRMEKEVSQSLKEKSWLNLLMIDIDDFKQFNDTYGHVMGDQALKFVARNIEILCHDESGKRGVYFFPTRYGGEEFAVILPAVDKKGAVTIAEAIREKIKNYSFVIRNKKGEIKYDNLNLTVSIGVSSLDHNQSDAGGIKEMVESADNALYQAKESGKNCVKA